MVKNVVSLYAVGDLHPDRANKEELFELVKPILNEADVTFAQLEGVFAKGGTLQAHVHKPLKQGDTAALPAIKNAGVKVVGCAGNHSMDHTNFLDMLDNLKKNGIVGIGMGKDIDEARKPAIFNIRGTRIGFLTRNAVSNLPAYHAAASKPGTAPIKISSSYEIVNPQPGTAPAVHTWANEADLHETIEDVKKLRPQVDVLVWSCHWGVHLVPKVIAEYQPKVAHMVIDAGADLILGHHPHLLKGIEIYKGKAIIYSLGNFAFDAYWFIPRETVEKYGARNLPKEILAKAREDSRHIGFEARYDPDYPAYQWPVPSRMSMIVKCSIQDKKIRQISIVPVIINKNKCQPQPVSVKSSAGKEVLKFLNESSEIFDTKLKVQGEEIRLI